MKRLVVVLVCLAVALSGCSRGDGGFTEADWDDFFDWCVEHRARPNSDCGGGANGIRTRVNDQGWDEACTIRINKRLVTLSEEALTNQQEDLEDEIQTCKPGG